MRRTRLKKKQGVKAKKGGVIELEKMIALIFSSKSRPWKPSMGLFSILLLANKPAKYQKEQRQITSELGRPTCFNHPTTIAV